MNVKYVLLFVLHLQDQIGIKSDNYKLKIELEQDQFVQVQWALTAMFKVSRI